MSPQNSCRLIFCSTPSYLFYQRGLISAYVLKLGDVAINPYMNFDYNLLNQADKAVIRNANNRLIAWCDSVTVFTDNPTQLPNGVLTDISYAKVCSGVKLPSFTPFQPESVSATSHNTSPIVYTAISKHLFYYKMFISKFVLEQGAVPVNPFMLFDYFIMDAVERPLIYAANKEIVKRSEQLWVFGPISDGVFDEIKIAKQEGKVIRYFEIRSSIEIVEVEPIQVTLEEELKEQIVQSIVHTSL